MSARPQLAEILAAPPAPRLSGVGRPAVPAADSPGTHEWDGSSGVIYTGVRTERPTSWDQYLMDAGLDPKLVEVVEPVQVRGWDGLGRLDDGTTGVIRQHYYRLTVRLHSDSRRPIEDILGLIKRTRMRPKPRPVEADATYSVMPADLQLGKIDGDGVEGTVTRMTDKIEQAAERYGMLRRAHVPVGPIIVAWNGDCIEGAVSQGGALIARTSLTVDEQVRVLRRLMYYAVEVLSPLTDHFAQIAVPGNHDEPTRIMGHSGSTRYDSSWDVDALRAVAEGLAHNPKSYGHVVTHTPQPDEMTVTIECADGTRAGFAHGHMWRPGQAMKWWSGQAFGGSDIGSADVLISGHGHHLTMDQQGTATGGTRTHLQVPAMESQSAWWRHRTGQYGSPGLATAVLAQGRINELAVL